MSSPSCEGAVVDYRLTCSRATVLVLASFAIAGCGRATDTGQIAASYDDAFTYCAAVGTADTPDSRYTGPAISDEVIGGYLWAAGLESTTEPTSLLRETTVWRCMEGTVYVCNVGANLACTAKADVSTSPSAAMTEFCTSSRDAVTIPASVTGRETVYSWGCSSGVPTVIEQLDEPDAAGFLSRLWYPIERGHVVEPRPEGEILLTSNRDGDVDDLYVLDLGTGDTTRLTRGETSTFPGAYSPDGSQLVYTGYGLVHSFIGIMDADGGNIRQLTPGDTDDTFPAWSPDGSRIAFTSFQDGRNILYVALPDGSGMTRLTDDMADDFAPTWSPDGEQIAFVSDRGSEVGQTSLFVMNSDGSNLVRLTSGPTIDSAPAWSPDGSLIAFRSHHDGPADIYVIAPDGSGLTQVTDDPGDDWAPSWSPDGRWLAFQTNRDGNWEIYVTSVDSEMVLNITQDPADDQMPRWRPPVRSDQSRSR